MSNTDSGKHIPVVSLFSGAGGMDLGFKKQGFEAIYAADFNAAAVQTYRANFPGANCHQVDLLAVSPSALIKRILSRDGGSSIAPKGVIGGPPCQGVSAANNGSSPVDPRNKLFARYASIVLGLDDEIGLDFFVFENVLGLTRYSKNFHLYNGLKKRLGKRFAIHEEVVNSAEHGVAQTRRRVIIVGLSKRLQPRKPISLAGNALASTQKTVRDVIGGFPEPDYFARGHQCNSAFHKNHWTMARKSAKFFQESAYESVANARSFIRLDWDKPSRTIAYGNREIHLHPDGRRRLSVYEAMLLQGFPNAFTVSGNLSEQVTQVSNAVPPPVAEAIAASIRQAIYER